MPGMSNAHPIDVVNLIGDNFFSIEKQNLRFVVEG
jgi:hypothetical protein